jgi:hypothetical protein
MANQRVSLTANLDEDNILRRRKLADALTQSSLDPIQTSSYQGIPTPISWAQGLAKLAEAGVAGYQSNKADTEASDLKDRRRQETADFLKNIDGWTNPDAAGAPGNEAPAQIPLDAAGRKRQLLAGMLSGNPQIADVAPSMYASDQQEAQQQRMIKAQQDAAQAAYQNQVNLKGIPQAEAPKPGVHIPYPAPVQVQRIETAKAGQPQNYGLPLGYTAAPGGGLAPIPGGPADPKAAGILATAKQHNTPPGYALTPDGKLAPIPGGPADPTVVKEQADARRDASLKPIPANINTAIGENIQAVRKINQALDAIDPEKGGDADATGWKGYLPNAVLNRTDPKGTTARALIADIGSLKVHDRSGAAVSASESPRLMPFIPLTTDDDATVTKKLTNFKNEYMNILNDMGQVYSPENGYKTHPLLGKIVETGNAGAKPPAPETIPEGTTATNADGVKIIRRNGKWEPYQ